MLSEVSRRIHNNAITDEKVSLFPIPDGAYTRASHGNVHLAKCDLSEKALTWLRSKAGALTFTKVPTWWRWPGCNIQQSHQNTLTFPCCRFLFTAEIISAERNDRSLFCNVELARMDHFCDNWCLLHPVRHHSRSPSIRATSAHPQFMPR